MQDMDFRVFEQRYMRVHGIYSKIIGIWPDELAPKRRPVAFFMYSLIVFSVLTQVARVVKFYSVDVLLEQIPFVCVPLTIAIKLSGYMLNMNKFQELFESMLNDWRQKLTDSEEKIMEKYARRGIFYTTIYIVNAYFVGSVFFFVPLMPYILDFIVPLNESRKRTYMYEAYYFIENQDNYYTYIVVYSLVTLVLAVFAFIAADSILIYAVQHCCGLLALAGHRFESSLRKRPISSNCADADDSETYRAVSYGISSHWRALSYLMEIENVYKVSLFLVVGASVLTFTATLLRASTVPLTVDTYQFYGYIAAQLVHMLFLTIQGQFIINVHDIVYQNGCNALWYTVGYKTQQLYIMILRQGLTPPLLTAGGLMQLNLDTYAEIIKASVSYFTVLKSV